MSLRESSLSDSAGSKSGFTTPARLGRTGLTVGRLGISSSFGAPAAAFEEAFERGCNYFTWGTFIRGRSSALRTAIRTITAARGWWQLPVGGGIVAQSDPQNEYEETWHKAAGLLRALQP